MERRNHTLESLESANYRFRSSEQFWKNAEQRFDDIEAQVLLRKVRMDKEYERCQITYRCRDSS